MKQYVKIALVLLLGVVLFAILYPIDYGYLVRKCVKDDAFYYYQIAHNLLHDRGLTFDGKNMTNGFHPLWFVCNLLFAWQPNKYIGFKMVLALGLLLHCLTAFTLYKLFRKFDTGKTLALVASGIYLLNPCTLCNAANGMESALVLLLMALLIYAIKDEWHNHLIVLLGIGVILARLDYAVFVVLILLWKRSYRDWTDKICWLILAMIPVTLFYLLTGGSPLPISGDAVSHVISGAVIKNWFAHPLGYWQHYVMLVILFILAVLIHDDDNHKLGLFIALGAVVFLGIQFLRGMIRPHYFIYMPLFVVILTVLALRSAKLWQIILACLVFGIHTGHYAHEFGWKNQCEHQIMVYSIMSNLNIVDGQGQQVEGLKIGCWNAGIAGFFCKYPVVNVDGSVNNTAYYAIRLHRLADYFMQDDIMLYFDRRETFEIYASYYGRPTRFIAVRQWNDYVLCRCQVAELPKEAHESVNDILGEGEVIDGEY